MNSSDESYFLTNVESMAKHDAHEVRRFVVKALRDSDVRVRLVASNQLVLMGKKSDVPLLERALAAEKDADARLVIESDLKILRQK